MRRWLLPVVGALCALAAQAAPLQPRSDDEVVERLAPRRAAAAAAADDPAAAVRDAAALLAQARAEGDPRPAGRALGRLARWSADPAAPAPVVLLLADAEQYLHRFDAAEGRLRALVDRDTRQPQAWLTLATLQRLRGRYAASDAACGALQALPAAQLHAAACLAENAALRGEVAPARATLTRLAAQADPSLRGWLLTSLGELELRAGRPQAAERALRAARAADPADGYAAIALADLLLDQRRPAEALRALDGQPGSDAVLLRRLRAGDADAAAIAAELRQRFAQAALRGGGAADALAAAAQATGHAREAALYAWWVEGDLPSALRLARLNLAQQREPADLLLFTRLAHAAGDGGARAEAQRLRNEMGLHDARLDEQG